MIAHLRQHREEFAEVAEMLLAEKEAIRITHGFAVDHLVRDVSLPPERLKRYRDVMRALNILGINRTDSCVYLLATNRGFAGQGSAKGYAFCPERPKTVVSSLDALRPTSSKFEHYFQSVDDRWYLLYIYSP